MKNRILHLILAFSIVISACKDEYSGFEDGIYANMETNKGKIIIQLYADKVPLTVANFVSLAEGTNPKVQIL